MATHPSKGKYQAQREAIEIIMQAANRPMKREEITEHPAFQSVSVSSRTMRQILSHMVKDKQIRKYGKRHYRLPLNARVVKEPVERNAAKKDAMSHARPTVRVVVDKETNALTFITRTMRVTLEAGE